MYLVRGSRNEDFHSALLVRPPVTADLDDFETRAPSFFAHDFLQTFPPLGDMTMAKINYDAGAHQANQIALAFIAKLSGF